VVTTLAHLGRIVPGAHILETPVGRVRATLHENGDVSIRNVPAYRLLQNVTVTVDGLGELTGDVAWGGNWFFLVYKHTWRVDIANVNRLTEITLRIKAALATQGITGRDGAEIDHIELFAPAKDTDADSKNFVLCPGGAYDRSPCGTGTSAKMACLHADGKIAEGELYRQAGILDTVFTASIERDGDRLIPTIRGRAYITAEAELLLDPEDPFRFGIRPAGA
jgi:4-hydroxyproline epimerase